MADIIGRHTALEVRQAKDQDSIESGLVLIAPPNRHLVVMPDQRVQLTDTGLVHFVRPSANLLFESAAVNWGSRVIGVVLTGTGMDGSEGVTEVKRRGGIHQAMAEQRTVSLQEVYFPAASTPRWLDIHLMPLAGPLGDALGVKVSFTEVTRERELTEALQQSRSDLETAYEELQSTNEELEAVNDELRARGNQLDGANAFLESILKSLRDGVAVIDAELRARAWNTRAEDLWGLRSDEVRNTYLLNLDIGLRFETLLQPIRDCLAVRQTDFEAVLDATDRRGRHIDCRVSLSPIDLTGRPASGVVILKEEIEDGSA